MGFETAGAVFDVACLGLVAIFLAGTKETSVSRVVAIRTLI